MIGLLAGAAALTGLFSKKDSQIRAEKLLSDENFMSNNDSEIFTPSQLAEIKERRRKLGIEV